MVMRDQGEENYDQYDPNPYQGGYDQAAVYGSVKPADETTAYAPSGFCEDQGGRDAQYGGEKNPYGQGLPGHSAYASANPRYERTQPSADNAECDYQQSAQSGYGGRRPSQRQGDSYEEQQPVVEEGDGGASYGYRKPKPAYGEETGYGGGGYGEEGSRPGYPRPRQDFGDEGENVDEGGYRGRPRTNHGEEGGNVDESGYRGGYGHPRTNHGEEGGNVDESGYRGGYGRPRTNYGEDETQERRENQEEGGYEGGYSRRPQRNRDEYSEEPAPEYSEE